MSDETQQIKFDEADEITCRPAAVVAPVPATTPQWRLDWARWIALSRARQARYRAAIQAANSR